MRYTNSRLRLAYLRLQKTRSAFEVTIITAPRYRNMNPIIIIIIIMQSQKRRHLPYNYLEMFLYARTATTS